MKSTRLAGLAAGAIIAPLVLAGCSGATEAPEAGATSGTLTVWMMTGGPGDKPIIEDVNAAFEKKYPDMDVKVEIQQWDNIATKLTTALASGNGPDIVEMGNTQTPLQTYSGGLLDITDDKASFEESDTWLAGLADPSTLDGRLYATPLYGGTKVVMYNKQMFADAGISAPPETLDELMAVCGTLATANAATDNFSGFYMPGQYYFAGVPFIFGAGGDVAVQKDGEWTATMSSAKAVEGLTAFKDFQNTCSTPSSVGVNTNNPDQTQIFADGQAAMAYVRGWEPAAVVEKNPEMEGNIGYFIMPGYTADEPLPVIVAGSTIGIAADTKFPEAAKDYLRIITGADMQARFGSELNLIPISPAFTPEDMPEHMLIASEAAKSNKSLPASPGQSTLESERYNEQFFASIVGGADLEKAAADYDTYVTKTLNAYGD
ncbi:extracellular solute-binding protein [Microbacterium sp. MYb62]|uniref:extracellular solute-binding protein n=1 Tax=Microbacterium sp. MYb62 TaxID=1848690 RepID=UPI000CFE1CA6|nr:extracellular solute-binding protein [Microbacterium sp. MYb62]PRB18273.1 ABC transporter substrate-binding protein [Microbacterium sp. MYb62]